MPRVSEIDMLIGHAYDCIFQPEGWGDLLDSCAQLVGGDAGVIYLKPRANSTGALLTSRDFDPSYNLVSYLSYYEARSPLIDYYRRQPEGHVRALGNYAFDAAYRETEFFQDWIRPQGFADMLGAHLVRTPRLYAWMSIRRAEQRGPYSAHEIRAADRLGRHLGRAIKLRFKFESACNIADSVRKSLDAVDFGVLIVDLSGKVLWGNRAADAILRAGDGLKLHHGRLACHRPVDASALYAAICAVAQPSRIRQPSPVDLSVRRHIAQRPLTVHVLPIASDSAWNCYAGRSGVAAVFVIDPLVGSNVDMLSNAYGLTKAESRVLREIVQCGGLVDAARKLRISVPTGRTHLQHIFEKTNVATQAELVRLFMMSSLQLRSLGR